jgi:hypothetical protein
MVRSSFFILLLLLCKLKPIKNVKKIFKKYGKPEKVRYDRAVTIKTEALLDIK